MCVFQKEKSELNEEIGLDKTKGQTSKNGVITMENLNLKFGVTCNELKDIMQLKSLEAKQKIIENHGSVESLIAKLDTDIQNGITGSEEDIQKRVKSFGKNEIPSKPPKSIFLLAFEAVQDATLIMLIICSIISIGLSFYHPPGDIVDEEFELYKARDEANLEWVEGAAIMVAVIVVVFVTAFNDWRKEKQFRGLKDKIENDQMASVIRKGHVIQVNVKYLVVGDICFLKYGDLIPADGIVVQANDLKIDESSLTGETDLIKKDDFNNIIVLSGTHVMEGSGRFLVTAVGLSSQTGIIMTLLGATLEEEDEEEKNNKNISSEHKKLKKKKKSKKERSVLQVKLGKLALQIGYCGITSSLFTFLVLCARMSIDEFAIKKNSWSNVYIKHIISYLIQAITVIVVAVPEGLPLAVTLALAFAVRQMTKDNNLVRHLDACETMGNATTICSDKTGTLTTNRMTAVQFWTADTLYEKMPEKNIVTDELKSYIFESISVNCSYSSMIEPCKNGGLPKQIGNKTECGLLGLITDLGGDYEKMRSQYPNDEFIKVYTFNSARKMMSTVIKTNDIYRLHSKGASEMVLSKCSYYLDKNLQKIKLTDETLNHLITNVVERMASDGLRTICVAYRDFNQSSDINWDDETNIINDLTCICLVGIEDPVRPEVPDAIKKCQSSGVVVRMVTGDNIATATSIAIKCGIVKPSDDFLILDSKEFNKRIRDHNGELKQELLDKVWPRLRVLARSSPQDKYNLVSGIVESKLNTNREVVAVTGDGTNDGPALKRADVGFAMGIQGTDVAKEASDIILTDDNFSSIVKAMMWGRNVYDAIAKFLQFQLTANFAAGIFSVVCAATIQAVPLKAVQMLWVNLVMDTLASLALATEPPNEDLLKRKPYGRNKSIISITMIKNIFFHTIYQCAILFGLVFGIEEWMSVDSVIKYNDLNKLRDPSLHFTIIFNAFVLMTLFNEINGRKIHNERNVFEGITKNSVFISIWLGCFIGQILIVNFGGIVFNVERLDIDHWMWCLAFGVGSLLWGQLVAFVPKSVFKKIFNLFCCCFKKKLNNKKIEIKNGNANMDLSDEDEDEHEDINALNDGENGLEKPQSLWLRGANRIHNQLQVIETFQSKIDDAKETCNVYGSSASLKDIKKENN